MLAKATGQKLAKIEQDVDRDFFMDAEEAERSGLVSRVVPAKKLVEEAMAAARDCQAAIQRQRRCNYGGELEPHIRQLTEALERWFRCDEDQPQFAEAEGRWILEVMLDELVGDFTNRIEPQALIQIRFTVTLDLGRTREVVFDQHHIR